MKEKGEGEVESTSSANVDMPVERILEAELAVEPKIETYIDTQVSWYDPLLNKSYCSLTHSPTLTLCLSVSLALCFGYCVVIYKSNPTLINLKKLSGNSFPAM